MTPTPDPEQSRKQILHDHHEIGELVSQVATASSAGAMLASLERLQPLLARHFKEEEEEIDGLHESILQRTPRHANALRGLKDEHRQLLAQAGELTELARVAKGDDSELFDLGRELKDRLATHEANETEVFVDSIWTDLGAGD